MITMNQVMQTVTETVEQYRLSTREANVLRLLAEEMLSMTETLLQSAETSFHIDHDETGFSLCLSARANVSMDQKREFVSLSPEGKNAKVKGVKARIMAVMEDFLYTASQMPPEAYLLTGGYGVYPQEWSMVNYLDNGDELLEPEWDGLEKSIIVNFADDVIVGADKDTVDLVVKKHF